MPEDNRSEARKRVDRAQELIKEAAYHLSLVVNGTAEGSDGFTSSQAWRINNFYVAMVDWATGQILP